MGLVGQEREAVETVAGFEPGEGGGEVFLQEKKALLHGDQAPFCNVDGGGGSGGGRGRDG